MARISVGHPLSPPDIIGRLKIKLGTESIEEPLGRREQFDASAPFSQGKAIPLEAQLTIRLSDYDDDYSDNDHIRTLSGIPLTEVIEVPQKAWKRTPERKMSIT